MEFNIPHMILSSEGRHIQERIRSQQAIQPARVSRIRMINVIALTIEYAQSGHIFSDLRLFPPGMLLDERRSVLVIIHHRLFGLIVSRLEIVVEVAISRGDPWKV